MSDLVSKLCNAVKLCFFDKERAICALYSFCEVCKRMNDQETVNNTLNKQLIKNDLFFRLNPPSSQIFLDVTELKRKNFPRDGSH